MNMKKIFYLSVMLVLVAVFMTACGECKHDYQERDGRVICIECKEICTHTYQVNGNDAYCTKCLFSCKHNYRESNGEMTCNNCGLLCNHKYVSNNGESICESCNKKCEHKFEEKNSKRICKHCGYEKVLLTMNNINDYFSVSVKIVDVTVQKDWLLSSDLGKGKAEIKVSNKKGVKYENVVLTIFLETTTDPWLDYSAELEISYDGVGEKTISITTRMADFISSNPPSYKAKIGGVTGEIAD